jgi:hypothetical protein
MTDALHKAYLNSSARSNPLDAIDVQVLITQRLFNLTHMLSFSRLLVLRIGETVPDYTSFWGFRDALAP